MTFDDPRTQRAWTWAKRFYLLSVLMYALLGAIFVASAWAQSRTVTVPLPSKAFLVPPAGSDDITVQRYFDYLHLQSIGNLGQQYFQNWIGLLEVFGFGAVFLTVFYFLVFAWFARRRSGDLYPVEVYNGYITERNGSIDPFNWALYAIILIFGVVYIAVSLRFAQLY